MCKRIPVERPHLGYTTLSKKAKSCSNTEHYNIINTDLYTFQNNFCIKEEASHVDTYKNHM